MEKKTFIGGIAAFGIIGVVATGVVIAQNSDSNEVVDTPLASSDSSSANTDSAISMDDGSNASDPVASSFKDGTYTATGRYRTPEGNETIKVSIVVAGNVVTDSTVVPEPATNTSKRYQGWFVSGYKEQVVGKDLATLMLDSVSGSSLTPMGFNDAINQIQDQAKA